MRQLYHPPTESIQLSQVLHALSDPARLRVVQFLLVQGEGSCNRCPCDLAKSTLSHHLRVLRESGILLSRVEGVRTINTVRLTDLESRFPGLLTLVIKLHSVEPERPAAVSPQPE